MATFRGSAPLITVPTIDGLIPFHRLRRLSLYLFGQRLKRPYCSRRAQAENEASTIDRPVRREYWSAGEYRPPFFEITFGSRAPQSSTQPNSSPVFAVGSRFQSHKAVNLGLRLTPHRQCSCVARLRHSCRRVSRRSACSMAFFSAFAKLEVMLGLPALARR